MAVIRTIDRMTAKIGIVVACILVPLLLIPNVYEVFSRYVLRDPTVWALDVTTCAFGPLFLPTMAILTWSSWASDDRSRVMRNAEILELGYSET